MNLHELSPAAGANKQPYRKGRGAGSGNGKFHTVSPCS